jgi:hypothetical protein
MAWLKRLANWAVRLLDLTVSRSEERSPTPDIPGARQATWPDVFLLISKLEKHGAEYVLIGGYALAFNGLVRQTGDVDCAATIKMREHIGADRRDAGRQEGTDRLSGRRAGERAELA